MQYVPAGWHKLTIPGNQDVLATSKFGMNSSTIQGPGIPSRWTQSPQMLSLFINSAGTGAYKAFVCKVRKRLTDRLTRVSLRNYDLSATAPEQRAAELTP